MLLLGRRKDKIVGFRYKIGKIYIVLYLANRGQSVYERDAVLPVRINKSLKKKKKKILKLFFSIIIMLL